MAKTILLQRVLVCFVGLGALGVGWTRYTLSKQPRTRQPGPWIYSTKLPGKGFAFNVVQKSIASDKHPTSVTEIKFHPGCAGAYKNRSASPPLHFHTQEDEQFEVISGKMGFALDGKESILGPGQMAYVPADRAHTFWNAQPDTTFHGKVTLINKSGRWSPNELFFYQKASLAFDHGGLDKIHPLQILTMLKATGVEIAAPSRARFINRYIICPIAELLGYKGSYAEYIGL